MTTYSLLQGVVQQGTAWRAASVLSDDYALAGKTGTAGKGRELVFVGFARDLVALLWVGVVSGDGAVSQQHASDVVVEPWARILRAYAPRDRLRGHGFNHNVGEQQRAIEIIAEELWRWFRQRAARHVNVRRCRHRVACASLRLSADVAAARHGGDAACH